MHILIIGGGGFLGNGLAKELLTNGGLIDGPLTLLTLVDTVFTKELPEDARLERSVADFSDRMAMESLLRKRPEVIFHLAAIVSGEAEKKLDLGMQINFHASLQLLELCRTLDIHPRIVFASSCAVFGGDVSKTVTDDTGPKPQSSYGTQKAMIELLMNDYSRRGFVDARNLRLPTIAIRPGKANTATSSFVSSIIREPLHGKKATYPVPLETDVWIQSPRRIIQNFIHAANVDSEIIGKDRTINLPGLTTSIKEMIESLEKITAREVVQLISHVPDAFLERIVLSWPPYFKTTRADELGFLKDTSAEDVIRSYIKEERILPIK